MKTRTALRRLPFALILVIAVLLGVMLGSGVALANDRWFDLVSGWNYLDGYQSDNGWGYTFYYWEWRNSSSTEVDVGDGIRYWNGWDVDPWEAKFGILWIYDEYGYDTDDFWNFNGFAIEGCDLSSSPQWTMDQLNSNNNYAICQQLIRYGTMFSDNVFAYTGIGSR